MTTVPGVSWELYLVWVERTRYQYSSAPLLNSQALMRETVLSICNIYIACV